MNWNEVGKLYERPWGSYETLAIGDGYQIKRIIVKPGQRLSLQKHAQRSEHWVAVAGNPTVVVDDQTLVLAVGQSVDIPVGAIHRMQNDTEEDAVIIEAQSGSYLGEDDIVRLEDDYGRGAQ